MLHRIFVTINEVLQYNRLVKRSNIHPYSHHHRLYVLNRDKIETK